MNEKLRTYKKKPKEDHLYHTREGELIYVPWWFFSIDPSITIKVKKRRAKFEPWVNVT